MDVTHNTCKIAESACQTSPFQAILQLRHRITSWPRTQVRIRVIIFFRDSLQKGCSDRARMWIGLAGIESSPTAVHTFGTSCSRRLFAGGLLQDIYARECHTGSQTTCCAVLVSCDLLTIHYIPIDRSYRSHSAEPQRILSATNETRCGLSFEYSRTLIPWRAWWRVWCSDPESILVLFRSSGIGCAGAAAQMQFDASDPLLWTRTIVSNTPRVVPFSPSCETCSRHVA